TNTDIWLVPVAGGSPRNLTAANQAADAQPAFSPDGKFLAWVSQARAGFEADQWGLNYVPTDRAGSTPPVPVSRELDRAVQSFSWAARSPDLVAVIDSGGYEPIVLIPTISRRAVSTLQAGGTHGAASQTIDSSLVFLRHQVNRPTEVYRASPGGEAVALT